jgi:hypothetical protein
MGISKIAYYIIGGGILLVFISGIWLVGISLGLGKLPGDIIISAKNSRIFIPITTSVIISIALTTILNLFRK